MRIQVAHRTTYGYDLPATHIVQALRLSPRNHDSQHVRNWRIDVDVDGRLREGIDPFGNKLHMFYADGPLTALTVTVTGEVEVDDSGGLVRGASEPLPASIFLRSTPLTAPDPLIARLADANRTAGDLPTLHSLMSDLHGRMAFDTGATESTTTAAAALAAGRGVCQDFAHIFVAAARHLGYPARYVSGHLARSESDQQDAAHAWCEILVPDLGWVAFDPTNSLCATDAYLRVAVGLDYLDAAPVRGARRGGGGESLAVAVHAVDAMQQRQS